MQLKREYKKGTKKDVNFIKCVFTPHLTRPSENFW